MNIIESMKEIQEKKLFYIDYEFDYKFDEFLKVGANSDLEVNEFIVNTLLDGNRMDFEHPNMGCSTFSAYLENGDKVFGRNFDEKDCMILALKTKPQNGYASLSVVNLSYIGIEKESLPLNDSNRYFLLAAPYLPLDGVNEKGLAIGILRINEAPANQQRGKKGITSTTMIRLVLDKCATVDEAIKLIDEYDMHSSANVNFHFYISDAKGESAVIEYVDHKMSVVKSKCATNFLLTEGYNVGGGHDRFEKMETKLKENNEIFKDMKESMLLLKDVSGDSTRWSAVYNQTTLSLLLSVGRDYEKLYEFVLFYDRS